MDEKKKKNRAQKEATTSTEEDQAIWRKPQELLLNGPCWGDCFLPMTSLRDSKVHSWPLKNSSWENIITWGEIVGQFWSCSGAFGHIPWSSSADRVDEDGGKWSKAPEQLLNRACGFCFILPWPSPAHLKFPLVAVLELLTMTFTSRWSSPVLII